MITFKKNKRHTPEIKKKSIISINTLIFLGCMLSVIFYHAFVTFECDTRFLIHKWTWYKKPIPLEWTCFKGKNLLVHKGIKEDYNGKTYFFCSKSCYIHFLNDLKDKNLRVTDAFTGDTILKIEAIVGLRQIGKSKLVYFKNSNSFNSYYAHK